MINTLLDIKPYASNIEVLDAAKREGSFISTLLRTQRNTLFVSSRFRSALVGELNIQGGSLALCFAS